MDAQGNKEESTCIRCNKAVLNEDEGVACDVCGVWFHAECVKVTKVLYKELKKQREGIGSVKWFCMCCSKAEPRSIVDSLNEMKGRQELLEGKVAVLESNAVEHVLALERANIEVVDLKNKYKILELQVSELVELGRPENKIKNTDKTADKTDDTAADTTADGTWSVKHGRKQARKARGTAPSKTKEAEEMKLAGDTLIIGDSLVEGVGRGLTQQHVRFRRETMKGARIEHVTQRVAAINRNGNPALKNLVLMAGTNNLACNGTEEIAKKYNALIQEAKGRKYERIIMVGIMTRSDLADFFESKRLSVNTRLKTICDKNKVEFVDLDFCAYREREEYLWKDGLHLNNRGADAVGRQIYDKFRPNLKNKNLN